MLLKDLIEGWGADHRSDVEKDAEKEKTRKEWYDFFEPLGLFKYKDGSDISDNLKVALYYCMYQRSVSEIKKILSSEDSKTKTLNSREFKNWETKHLSVVVVNYKRNYSPKA